MAKPVPLKMAILCADDEDSQLRANQWIRGLPGDEVRALIVPLSRSPVKRWLTSSVWQNFDIICVTRRVLSGLELRTVRRKAKRLVYDMDCHFDDSTHKSAMKKMLAKVDAVFYANDFLANEHTD